MATWGHLLFQDRAAPLIEQLIFFHDHSIIILFLILILVMYIIGVLFINQFLHRFLLEGQEIEVIWTMFPALVLIFIALPSLRLLYLLDEVNNPSLRLKVIGHQWYWSYEYSDFEKVSFDSYILRRDSLDNFGFRLLDVDNRVVVPYEAQIRYLISSSDVLHAWTVPAVGIKIDAVPGRLNQTASLLNRSGLFFGQCSEICGANHSFMPIVIERISLKNFFQWILNFKSLSGRFKREPLKLSYSSLLLMKKFN